MFALGPARIPQGQQFPTGARINGAHPLAQGLGFLGVCQGQLAYDLVGGTAAALTGALVQKTIRSGQALAFTGASANRLTWPTQTSTSWQNANSWTLSILGRMLEADYASSNLYPVLVKHSSSASELSVGFEDVSGDMRFSIQIDATGLSQPGAVSIGTAGGTNALGISGAQTALYTWRLSGTTLDCFVNGVLKDTITVTAHGANVAAAIGTANTGDAISANGAIQAWFVHNRALSQSEIVALATAPWSMFANVASPDPYLFDGGSASGATGTSATTNASDTSAATGTTTVKGSSATTNANDAPAASGTTKILGTSATTSASDTSAASGTTKVVGSSVTTNANDTATASGSIGSAVSGTVSVTNANDTSSASGTTKILGVSATTNANDTSSASGTTKIVGTISVTNANDVSAASGQAGSVTGTIATTNANDVSSAFGSAGVPDAPVGHAGGRRKRQVIIDDVIYLGTDEQIEAKLWQLLQERKKPIKAVKQAPKKKAKKPVELRQDYEPMPAVIDMPRYEQVLTESFRHEDAFLQGMLYRMHQRYLEDEEDVAILLMYG